MNKGKIRKNFGPCIVCGNQDHNAQYRKITILKINKNPNIENLNIKLQVDDHIRKFFLTQIYVIITLFT